jgi:hypothetical protein
MAGNPLVSGTAASVAIGAGSILTSIFIPAVPVGDRIILFFIGLLFFIAGLLFSQA